MPITITAKGLIELWRDGALVSSHTVESKAIESALAHAEVHGNGDYELRFPNKVVKVSLLTKTVIPFSWRPILVEFREHTAFTVDLAAFLDNPEAHAVVYQALSALPAGVTLTGSLLAYDGLGAPGSRALVFTASLGSLVATSSPATVSVLDVNVAPAFTVAPPTASLPATGGTVQFTAIDPDGDPIAYSLPVTRAGITINATTGLVTVASSAAGTNGNITVRATDGSLAVSATCAVTVAAAPTTGRLDYHPGHYVTTSGNNIDQGAIATAVNYAKARSYLKGIVIRPFWRQLETTLGNYDFSLIDYALSTLGTGKYFWLQIQTAIFNNASAGPADLLPSYLTTAAYDGGAYDDGTSVKTKLWNSAVMDRKIALIQALAARYNNTANFEGVLTGETAQSIATNEVTNGVASNYSPAAYASQLTRLMPAARAAFSKKQLMLYVNYISGSGGSNYFQPILDAARAADYVVGGPDSLYWSPSAGRNYINGTSGTTNYRGKIGIQVGDQTSGLTNKDHVMVVADMFRTCFTPSPGGWGANYGFWALPASQLNFGPIMSYIQANEPACVTTYPTEFP